MKKLLIVLAVLALPLAVNATDAGYAGVKGLVGTLAKDTITTQHIIGSYTRVCSLANTEYTALDSGDVIIKASGVANLSARQVLYIGIDSADATTDTAYAHTTVSAPPRAIETMKIPFLLTATTTVDSAGVVNEPVITMGTRNSTDAIVVENLLLELYLISNLEN